MYIISICTGNLSFSKSSLFQIWKKKSSCDELDFYSSSNLILLPALDWEIQIWNRPHFKSFNVDISNYEKYQVQLENVKNQVQIDRWINYLNLDLTLSLYLRLPT